MPSLSLKDSDDDSLRALDFILDAWELASEADVPTELMAYAALYAALTDLVAAFGEEAVAALALGLGPRIQKGEFTVYDTRQ
jgi:hypothetical protein